MKDLWDPVHYDRFTTERTAPLVDLLSMIQPVPGGRVADLGCGSGAITRTVHRHVRARETIGLDNSVAMLKKAQLLAGDGLRFEQRDVTTFADQGLNVVFSYGLLQSLPDHEQWLKRLVHALAPGGQLAVQMSANYDYPSHLVARELATEEPFCTALNGYRHVESVQPPEWYATALYRLGVQEQSVRLQVYAHCLDSPEDVVEWVRQGLLIEYESRMPSGLFNRFLARYKERLLRVLDDTRPFFYPFKRILLWGRRGS